MSTAKIGRVVQIIGPVVDVEFPRDQMPKVYEALIIDDESSKAEA
jgi:F-type H+-transporting ATPase subunit beta